MTYVMLQKGAVVTDCALAQHGVVGGSVDYFQSYFLMQK